MIKYIIIAIFTTLANISHAQQINGYIYDLLSSQTLYNAEVKNLRTNEVTTSNRDGSFTISGKVNDYLAIDMVGYITDTVFYYDDQVRRIYLNKDQNILHIDEVLVKRLTDNILAQELEKAKNAGKTIELPRNQGGIKISPSRVLGKEAKNARKNVEILLDEYNYRKVDRRFTKHLISSLLPLNDTDLSLFRERFRPTLEFIENTTDEDLKVYIIESYTTFKK